MAIIMITIVTIALISLKSSTDKRTGMHEYCKIECKGYK